MRGPLFHPDVSGEVSFQLLYEAFVGCRVEKRLSARGIGIVATCWNEKYCWVGCTAKPASNFAANLGHFCTIKAYIRDLRAVSHEPTRAKWLGNCIRLVEYQHFDRPRADDLRNSELA